MATVVPDQPRMDGAQPAPTRGGWARHRQWAIPLVTVLAVTVVIMAVAGVFTRESTTTTSSSSSSILPGAPTGVRVLPTHEACVVDFAEPSSLGTGDWLRYVATSSPSGLTGVQTDRTKALVVRGLTNGVPYTFTVRAETTVGRSPESPPSAEQVPFSLGNVVSFGFHAATRYIAEIDDFTQLNLLLGDPDPAVNLRIMRDRGTGQRAMIDLRWIFWGNTPDGTLDPNWQRHWDHTHAQITAELLAQVGCYYLDEPLYGMMGGAKPPAPGFRTLAQAEEQLQIIVDRVKALTRIPLMIVFAPTIVSATLRIPPLVDLVGFSKYEEPWETKYRALYTIFRAVVARNVGQRIVMLAQADREPEPDINIVQSDELQLANLNRYWQLACTDPLADHLLVFLLSWDGEGPVRPGTAGARDLPAVYARCQELGRQIKYGSQTRTTAPATDRVIDQTLLRVRDRTTGRYWALHAGSTTRQTLRLTSVWAEATAFRPSLLAVGERSGLRLQPHALAQPNTPWAFRRQSGNSCVSLLTTDEPAGQVDEANFWLTDAASAALVHPAVATLYTSYHVWTVTLDDHDWRVVHRPTAVGSVAGGGCVTLPNGPAPGQLLVDDTVDWELVV